MRVLMTGGLGYLGGRIATYMSQHLPDHHLRLTAHRSLQSVPAWAQALEVVQADMRDRDSLEIAVDGMDLVVHLAAVNEVVSAQDPMLALDVNTRGTYLLLKACQEKGVRQFIYVSTFHVYGPRVRGPITEETPTRPVHPYALTHRAAEDLVNWFRKAFGFQTLILRLSNGYGYPADPLVDRWSLVFNDLCRQAVVQGCLVLRSSGRQQRDFISLKDIARAVHHLLALGPQGWGDGLLNLGGECSLSIREVAETVAREYGKRYNREITVTVGSDPVETLYEPVEYDIRKIKRTGFTLTDAMSEEVQGTLALCERVPQIQAHGAQG